MFAVLHSDINSLSLMTPLILLARPIAKTVDQQKSKMELKT
jgi:hypothetical protein